MVPQRHFCCLLTVSNVCLKHMVLLGLKNIFQFRSHQDKRWAEEGGLRPTILLEDFNFIPPLSRWVLFAVFPFLFLILPFCFPLLPYLQASFLVPHFWKGEEAAWIRMRWEKEKRTLNLLVLHSSLCHLLLIKLCLYLQSQTIQYIVFNLAFSKYWAPTVGVVFWKLSFRSEQHRQRSCFYGAYILWQREADDKQ